LFIFKFIKQEFLALAAAWQWKWSFQPTAISGFGIGFCGMQDSGITDIHRFEIGLFRVVDDDDSLRGHRLPF
jgi:predicted membrane metal-binding protein